ncbi:hypothetical protein MASR2M66_17190 [Chloroflexota bacterium]
MNNSSRINRVQSLFTSWIDKWTLAFAFIGIVYGVVVAVASGYFGILILLALLGAIALALVVFNPDLGVAMVLMVLFGQVQRAFVEVQGWPGPGRPLVAFMIGVVGLRFLLFSERPTSWIRNNFILAAYAISLLISVVAAKDFPVAFEEFKNFLENLLVVSIILFIVQSSPSLKRSIWAVIAIGIFMASVSVFQNLTKTFDHTYLGFGGWEYSGYVGRPRMTGPYETPNPYAQILSVIFILALERGWRAKKILLRMFAIAGAGIMALALIYTDSRGGFLGLIFTVMVFLLFNRPSISSVLVITTIGLILMQFLPSNYTERILTLTQLFNKNTSVISDESFRGRTSENIAAWRMFLDHPIFGVGLDNFSEFYQSYSREIGLDDRREARDPASLYLQLLASQGLLGTAVHLGIVFLVLQRLYRSRKELLDMGYEDEASIASALFAALIGYMFMSIYKNNAYANAFWSLMSLCMAVSQITFNLKTEREENRPLEISA